MAAVDRKLVHKQFNSPIGLYSENNIKETLDREIKAFGGSGIEIGDSIPSHLANSAVLKMLQEEEETYTGYKRVAWPPANETKPFIREFTPQPAYQDQQGNSPYPQQPSPQPAGRTSLQPQYQSGRQMIDNQNYPSNQQGLNQFQNNTPSNPSYQNYNPQSQHTPNQQYNNLSDAKPQYDGNKPTQNNYPQSHQNNMTPHYQPQQHQQASSPYNSYGNGNQSPNPQLNQAQSPDYGHANAHSPQHLQPQKRDQPSAYEQHLQQQQSKPVQSNYQFNNPQLNNAQRAWAPVQPPLQQSNYPISFQNQNTSGQYPGSPSPMAQQQQPQQSFGRDPIHQQQPQQTFGQTPMHQQQPQQSFGQTPMHQQQPQQTFGQKPMHQQQPQQYQQQQPLQQPQQQPQQYAQQQPQQQPQQYAQQQPQQYAQQHQQPQQYQQHQQPQQHQPQQYQQQFNEPYYGQSQQQNSPYHQQVGSQQQQQPNNTGVITLRQETPISQIPVQTIQSQPAARSYRGGSLMRGDLKWPPPDCRALMEAEAEHERQLAMGPQCRPTKMHKVNGDEDYSNFFARHALAHNYPGYKVPPGTQHIYA